MSWTCWPAPAKLNLFLHVLGRRADGYHELQTLFQFVEFGDEVLIEPTLAGDIRLLEGAPGVPSGQDLVERAARSLKAEAGVTAGARLSVRKRIPMGSGLGGGSSDAATVLVVLNRLWGAGLTLDELADLGLALGADVPVFVRGQAAWAEGVGERLMPVSVPEPHYLIAWPEVSVSTAHVFEDAELTRNSPPITMSDFLAGGGRNDCEPVVRRLYPEVARMMDWLERHAPARLTGTGGAAFAIFEHPAHAHALLRQLPPGCSGVVASGCNHSALHRVLSACGPAGSGAGFEGNIGA
ncbi:4-(cytidine 5'-diphospho)-2-C-methyl-D-erythritol kinase [Candidatus Macondimonas diazotrophica]|jgi:4-diphosphocytidyl-2-C-methyl-D-erythritol kinase|nr:4-(cytidine 5'-diphospho)-2-C-methyl-D-erythritol kinase [Candidatus Macondimonas diazotrophica]HBG50624.1 4-(cytidine 5'-diphospho)-2-C-methyl-D-erythritol kinase [Gammaproteobacteria bacterium]